MIPFKQYERRRRELLAEETFHQGMYYTNAPLPPGFVKMLVNFDIKDRGRKLVPRSGLQAFGESVSETSFEEGMMILDGRLCWGEDGEEYEQILIGDSSALSSVSGGLYEGPLHVATGSSDLHLESAVTSTFVKPEKAEIHGLEMSEVSSIARHVGTFAYNNNYYFFSEGELKYTKFDGDHYVVKTVEPKYINPKEAVLWGYNMLKDSPYNFENKAYSGAVQVLGVLPYDPENTDELMMTPKVNDDVLFKCFYEGDESDTYKVKWEWKEPVSSSWNVLKEEEEVSLDGLPEISASFTPSTKEALIRVTFTDTTDNFPTQVMVVGFDFSKERHGTMANIEVKNYDLTKATGMTYWERAKTLVLYGLEENPTILFRSDVNDPSYFPYPHNVDIFGEPVVYAVPFLDDMLVFTSTKLHLMSMPPEGEGQVIVSTIQSGLNINPWDIHLITVVRNMVFFKSGNYYYMVVPKRDSTTGELSVAPVSKNVEFFFDNFEDSIKEILDTVYQFTGDLELVHYYNFLDFEDVHNVYVFKVEDVYLNISLLYNTVDRTWRIQIYESPNIYLPFAEDATQKGILMCLISKEGNTGVQFLGYNNQEVKDFYFEEGPFKFYNYQFLDTGSRDHQSDLKKRYREVQFRINKIDSESLNFYSEFAIDERPHKLLTHYKPVHITDSEDPDYGLLYLEEELTDPSVLPNITKLAEYEDEEGCWELDFSVFPDVSFWKIRVGVSGKGYSPKFKILSKNEYLYELLNVSWVFRLLNAR